MAGWPTLISRLILGPELADVFTPPNARHFIGATVFKLAWWTLAGTAQTAAKMRVVFKNDGTVLSHSEAWHPNGDGPAPGITHPGTGQWEITLPAATEPDENGDAVATGHTDIKVFPQSTTLRLGTGKVNTDGTISVRLFTDAGAAADMPGAADRIVVEVN